MVIKNLKTLVQDVYTTLEEGASPSLEATRAFGERLAGLIGSRLSTLTEPPRLRMSNLGTKCNRKLWYSVNHPELGEKLPGHVRMKFLFGDVIEELVLFLSEVSGHDVSGRQSQLNLHGVKGSRDAVVDGVLVDVKSASSMAFRKFETGLTPEEDSFGYLEQLGAYREASGSDKAAFIAVDKTLGHICVDEHGDDLDRDWKALVDEKTQAISQKEPPERYYQDVPDGAAGNRKLGTDCSYCSFKETCWKGLRTFAYSNGPRYLTRVVRVPDVPEITGAT